MAGIKANNPAMSPNTPKRTAPITVESGGGRVGMGGEKTAKHSTQNASTSCHKDK